MLSFGNVVRERCPAPSTPGIAKAAGARYGSVMGRWSVRRTELLLGVAWLVLVVFGAQAAGPVILGAGLGALGCYLLVRKVLPALLRAQRSQRPLRKDFEILPPGERYGARSPASLAQLASALEEGDVGAVERLDGRIRVRQRNGHWAEVAAPENDAHVGTVRLEASTLELAVACCDALAPRLGPMRLRAGGLEVFVDGTKPRAELEEEVRQLQLTRARQIRDELEAPPAPAPKQYLN
jgi:hypothetical protein